MTTAPVILVGVDGSAPCMQAVGYISQMLSPEEVAIELFHVRTEAPETVSDIGDMERSSVYAAEIGNWVNQKDAQIHEFMDNAQKVFTDAGFPPGSVNATVRSKKQGIARDIINESKLGYCAVVIGRKGEGTLPDFMVGGIAAKLAESITHVPLAIVGSHAEPHKVLVAFDLCRCIRKGFEKISHLFPKSLEEILLCHVIRPLSVPRPITCTYFTTRTEANWLDEQIQRVTPAMVLMKKRLSRIGFDPKIFRTAILKEKTTRAGAIAEKADVEGIGTIVVGRHGHTAVDEFTMGRVTRKILSLSFKQALWIV